MTLPHDPSPLEPEQPPTSPFPGNGYAHQPYPIQPPTGHEQPFTLDQLATSPASPSRSRRGLTVALVGVLALAVLAGGTGYVFRDQLFKDSGVAACEAMRDGRRASPATATPTGSSSGKFTVGDYHRMRDLFAKSRHGDLRDAGTKMVDLLWQMAQADTTGEGALGMILILGGQMVQAYSSLSGACANHGVDIPKLGA
jgi:hypothetical protein